MKAIAYISEASKAFDEQQLAGLSAKASSKNQSLRITGYLYYRNGKFFQYIEGNRGNLDRLMRTIEDDDRHTITNMISSTSLETRRFPEWSMNYITDQKVREIRVEDIIEQHFRCLQKNLGGAERWERMLWDSVSRIAKLQSQLGSIKPIFQVKRTERRTSD